MGMHQGSVLPCFLFAVVLDVVIELEGVSAFNELLCDD